MAPEISERLRLIQADITTLPVDAVVNAANSSLMGGGGVDGAIHRAGGPAILRECNSLRTTEYPDGLPPGSAAVTTAGNLPAKMVIHTVGPIWKGGKSGESSVLASAYHSSLEAATAAGAKSIAFPAISTGVYSYPKAEAAEIAHGTVIRYLQSHALPVTVFFVFFTAGDLRLFAGITGMSDSTQDAFDVS